jgi:hypothetical protein
VRLGSVRADGHGDQRHPEPFKVLLAMAVSLTPFLSRREGRRGALRATFIVRNKHSPDVRPPVIAVVACRLVCISDIRTFDSAGSWHGTEGWTPFFRDRALYPGRP